MPFATDNSWPPGLLTIFQHARNRRTTRENRYYGPYDKLLNYCFGDTFTFYVAPQSNPRDDSYENVDVVVSLVVFDSNDKPVLLVEVKDDSWIERSDTRYRADLRLRSRYDSMLPLCSIPRLWGLSLLGTSMRVYCGDKEMETVDPPPVPRPDPGHILPQSYLAGEWSVDILSQEGFAKMKEIITDILFHSTNA